jgi:hypothetical protein
VRIGSAPPVSFVTGLRIAMASVSLTVLQMIGRRDRAAEKEILRNRLFLFFPNHMAVEMLPNVRSNIHGGGKCILHTMNLALFRSDHASMKRWLHIPEYGGSAMMICSYVVAPLLNLGTSGALIWCCGVSNLRR